MIETIGYFPVRKAVDTGREFVLPTEGTSSRDSCWKQAEESTSTITGWMRSNPVVRVIMATIDEIER